MDNNQTQIKELGAAKRHIETALQDAKQTQKLVIALKSLLFDWQTQARLIEKRIETVESEEDKNCLVADLIRLQTCHQRLAAVITEKVG